MEKKKVVRELNTLRQSVNVGQFNQSGSDCGCDRPTVVELQIPYEVDCLERNVSTLSNWLSDLEVKLSPAIYQIPQPDCKAEKDPNALCSLAEKLRNINNQVVSLRQRIEGTMAGLQI